ncbi:ankyrin repeat protein SKIP35-like [Phragmites australis]|uniref:ankyrin repeat protein SKIP35-like n=1 Tax=Phragmites australis TaxID=29695 RepID=UPI002D78B171|nr:ankyrin repeat protein SKIP35-like [Phragmites australis]XP_062223047.1 ankyrin repeat protein SKIP35-like [Phragmites australis]XP_062223048.1 ankyrin repeat protein SKIP35-like [Phragmites australis]
MVEHGKPPATAAMAMSLKNSPFVEVEADDIGQASGVVFAREGPLAPKNDQGCSVSHVHGDVETQESDGCVQSRGIDEHGWVDFGHSLQLVLFSRQWGLAESLVALADQQSMLDYGLSVALDAIWFLRTKQDLEGLNRLISKIVASGAKDFARAILRTSLLASCVAACQSKALIVGDSKEIVAERLHDRLRDCPGADHLKIEAGVKVQKFMEWALQCINMHHCSEETQRYRWNYNTLQEVQLHLSAFRAFLDIAGDNLSGKIFTEAFDAACFPLTLFSSLFEPGWSSGSSAVSIKGLLSLLVEGGADNVNQCFLEAARFGSTELVRILLKIAHQNSLAVDTELALVYASHYCKFDTMECLVDEGNAGSFIGPLIKAAERGCLQVIHWFVSRGVSDIEMCLALTTSASSGHFVVASFLLAQIPQNVLEALSQQILKAARGQGSKPLDGVAFLLKSNFLRDAAATYEAADSMATGDTIGMPPDLVAFLKEHWSKMAFAEGVNAGEAHFVNITRVLRRGASPICLQDLPVQMLLGIAYLPLYRACLSAGGQLLPQRLRGELVEAVNRLGELASMESQGKDLVLALERHLPSFLIGS